MLRYPDFDVEQAQALSYIMGCPLAQKAFVDPPFHNYANIVCCLVEEVDRLADNCHMPEFTNHALPHICSIVRRASAWSEADGWIDQINTAEAGYLLIALIIHDLGMLSQDAQDLPDAERISSRKGMSDLAAWVRSTHVSRLPKLVQRLLSKYRAENSELDRHLNIAIGIAASHSFWPWQKQFSPCPVPNGLDTTAERLRGLNAVVAVADLLDEDSNRCDTATLLRHKHGNNMNIAHWLRHSLTAQVLDVQNKKVRVRFRLLPDAPEDFKVVYCALHNHYRLALFYQDDLSSIGASIQEIVFESEMVEDDISSEINIWKELPDFKFCLVPRLLSTFEDEAKLFAEPGSILRHHQDKAGLESLFLTPYRSFLYPAIPYTDEERVILYIMQKAGE